MQRPAWLTLAHTNVTSSVAAALVGARRWLLTVFAVVASVGLVCGNARELERTLTPATVRTHALAVVTAADIAHGLVATNAIPAIFARTVSGRLVALTMAGAVKCTLVENAFIVVETLLAVTCVRSNTSSNAVAVVQTNGAITGLAHPALLALALVDTHTHTVACAVVGRSRAHGRITRWSRPALVTAAQVG